MTALVWAVALGTLLAGPTQTDGSTGPLPDRGEPAVSPPSAFASQRAAFSVRFRDIVNPYRVFLMTAVPGERVRLEVVGDASLRGRYSLETDAGRVERLSEGAWAWDAPAEEGTYRVVIRREPVTGSGSAGAGRPAPGDAITLNAVVMVPMETLERGAVHGYKVGDFPQEPYRDMPQYRPPRGFIPLTPSTDLQVSPHFTLSQFPCKGPPGFPKYVVLSEKLLLKLELLLERANEAGIEASTFQVLSAFRSPWYNANIGRPRYSRHIYGDAADIYVDNDADGRMDDLNGDGRIDLADASVLHRMVEEMDGAPETAHLIGGLGQYPTTSNHGPFIHVDTREYRARW
jgi:hypothetical protein